MSRHEERRWELWSGCCTPYVLWQPDGQPAAVEAAPVPAELELDQQVDLDLSAGRVGW